MGGLFDLGKLAALWGVPPHLIDPRQPEPTPEPEVPDIEIGRYALRTFNLGGNMLHSVAKSYTWQGGVCVAECLSSRPCANPPVEYCHCGVYGTVTLDSLISQYRSCAKQCIAVIAAEGTTIIGDRGLRTAAARVVAYWCADTPTIAGPRHTALSPAEIFHKECPEAKRFTEVAAMLAEYDFPESGLTWPPPPPPPPIAIGRGSIAELLATVPLTPGGAAALKHILDINS